jgi:hypothetical protein
MRLWNGVVIDERHNFGRASSGAPVAGAADADHRFNYIFRVPVVDDSPRAVISGSVIDDNYFKRRII